MQTGVLVMAALLFAVGGVFMKYSEGMTRLWPSILVLLCFCAGASAQAVAMRRAEMGPVYIFVLALEAVVALVLSMCILGEKLSLSRAAAVLLIVLGMVLLKRS